MDWMVGFFAAAAGAMGLGGGGILLMYLTAVAGVAQLRAQGINLIFFLPVAAVALVLHWKNGFVRWRVAGAAILAGLPGVFLGAALAGALGEELLQNIFAVFLLILGARELFAGKEKEISEDKSNEL